MFEQFFSNFYGFTFADVLLSICDIAIVWFLIYQMIVFLRGTKAMQALFGVFILVAMYMVSKPSVLDLATLNWILDKFMTSFVIILVIIFHEDIRRALGEFGKADWLMSKNEDRLSATPIEEIVKAATMLSEAKIGALIVIQMDAVLDQYMVEGIKIDATISKELLVSLFFKDNPTHDGAVIIRNQRIDSAGCFLPLSSNDRIDKSLGTRHRAAIGLSESTDAVIIVVSEETGAISVAHSENLKRKLTAEELREYLHRMFVLSHALHRNIAGTSALVRWFRAWRKRNDNKD